MRIRIPIHPAFLENNDEILVSDGYEKATKKATEKSLYSNVAGFEANGYKHQIEKKFLYDTT